MTTDAPFRYSGPHLLVPAANWSRHIGPQKKRRIVLHAMQFPEKQNAAEWCADYFAGLTRDKAGKFVVPKASAHFCVDSNSVVACVSAELVAWHAPGCNGDGIGIEHAGFAEQTGAQWLDPFGRAMLDVSAKLCSELCRHFGIPIWFLDAEALRSGVAGITTHEQVSLAFKKSTHTDPGGGFPMRHYLDLVRTHADGARLES